MSPGIKILILILVGILAITGIVFLLMPKGGAPGAGEEPVLINQPPDNGGTPIDNGLPVSDNGKIEPVPAPQASQEEKTRELIRQLAMAFAERFGSFSSQGNFENITDLLPMMTQRLRLLQERQIAKMRLSRQPKALEFNTTTRVLVVEIPDLAPGAEKISLLVKTQRVEQKGEEPKPWYQDLELKLLKDGQAWKVDEANWK